MRKVILLIFLISLLVQKESISQITNNVNSDIIRINDKLNNSNNFLIQNVSKSDKSTSIIIEEKKFNNYLIKEEFNSLNKHFPITTTSDNYFILDNGDYLLSRNNNESEYAIIAGNSIANDFILNTSIRIGPSKKKNKSVGIILKAQKDGQGAIIFEINSNHSFRIKELKGDKYKIYGNINNGWNKTEALLGEDKNNTIEIRSKNNLFIFIINEIYVASFENNDYKEGYNGLIISPSTKARIGYYHLREDSTKYTATNNKEINNIPSWQKENTTEYNSKYRNDYATQQKEQIANLNTAINRMQEEIVDLKSEHNKEKFELEQKINQLTQENTRLNQIIDEKDAELISKKEHENKLQNNTIEIEKITIQFNNQISKLNNKLLENKKTYNSQIETLNITHKEEIKKINDKLSEKKAELTSVKERNIELELLFTKNTFTKNNIDSKDIIRTTKIKNVSQQKTIQDTIYAVQIGVYTDVQTHLIDKRLNKLWYKETTSGTYIYFSGKFKTGKEATKHKNTLIEKGYPNAFVVLTH